VTAPATPDLLARARERVRAGDLPGAERLCREILEADADNADARGLLGAGCLFMGKLSEAAEHLQRAVRLNPAFAAAHANLGIVLSVQGSLDEAVAHFRQALAINPFDVGTQIRLADGLAKQDRLEDAEAAYRQCARLAPGQARAHFGLGMALAGLGRLQEAEASYRQALRLSPDSVETMVNLANLLMNKGELDGAILQLRQALALRPDFIQARINLAHALTRHGEAGEAIALLQEALRLRPDSAEAHNNMGAALAALGRHAEADARYREALRLRPDDPDVHDNLGALCMKQGRLEDAMERFEQAVRLGPDHAEARLHRAMAWLLAGDFERGWPEFEWRWRSRGFQERRLPRPRWDGSPLTGRVILLYAEQGLGDTFQFVRYAPLLKARGASVIVECQEALVPILRGCAGIDRIVPRGQPLPDYDVQAPLLSLPGILRTSVDSVPANVPYLTADARLVEHWRQELCRVEGLKIGIAWQGNPKYPADRERSIPLARFAPIARLPGVHLVSLQKTYGTEQIKEVAREFSVTDFGTRLDEANGPFMDTAAIMMNLDLVVTSDTAIPHLAGALGVPVWMALPKMADFRYLLRRDDSPWYPTMRLFRQTEAGNWEEVFGRLAVELGAWQPRRATPPRRSPRPGEMS
jgi:tetratricopeptide (TPR) repeat protein